MQTKLRTNEITPNNNICFPIGTILAVQKQYENLGFYRIFSKYKKKGRDLNSLLMGLVSYKLTENFSISKASEWINRKEVLDIFNLGGFEERTLFRTLETIGENMEEIIADIQDNLFQKYDFEHTNIKLVLADKMKYLTAKKLNKSDDKRIKEFDRSKAELIDEEKGIYGIKFVKPSSIDYFYFSEALRKQQLESRARSALRKLQEAKDIQNSIDKEKQLPKKFRINNVLIDVSYSYQTKLEELDEEEALKLVQSAVITGREGFFCLKSNENLTLEQALQTYRKKDSIEKIMHSLKNEIEIKPLRVWSEHSIYGALIIGFIAQLFISLMRYELNELKHISTKFIKNSLMNLTVTVDYMKNGVKKFIYANFDQINTLILRQRHGIS